MTHASHALGVALVLVGTACTESLTAPGACPTFCPDAGLTVVDTVLGAAIGRDSAFRGYVVPHEAAALLAASFAWIDSRPIFRTGRILPGWRFGTDTTLRPLRKVDSLRLELTVVLRDTGARNLSLHLYRLPLGIDSTTTFAGLAGPFVDSLVRSVSIDNLLALPGRRDPATRDSIAVDTTDVRRLTLFVGLDSAHAPFVPADSGALAFGLRVTADTLAGIALDSSDDLGTGPRITWYITVDSAGTEVRAPATPRFAEFDSFVFDPPPPALDSTLAVGGVPSARSILRVALPRFIRDSTQVVRATLILVPAAVSRGVPADSFQLVAHLVETDLGAKSPLAQPRFALDSSVAGFRTIRIGTADTVRVELTPMVRRWTLDTTIATAIMLRQIARAGQGGEGGTLAEIRFRPSGHAAFRPALHVTYVPRYAFGVP